MLKHLRTDLLRRTHQPRASRAGWCRRRPHSWSAEQQVGTGRGEELQQRCPQEQQGTEGDVVRGAAYTTQGARRVGAVQGVRAPGGGAEPSRLPRCGRGWTRYRPRGRGDGGTERSGTGWRVRPLCTPWAPAQVGGEPPANSARGWGRRWDLSRCGESELRVVYLEDKKNKWDVCVSLRGAVAVAAQGKLRMSGEIVPSRVLHWGRPRSGHRPQPHCEPPGWARQPLPPAMCAACGAASSPCPSRTVGAIWVGVFGMRVRPLLLAERGGSGGENHGDFIGTPVRISTQEIYLPRAMWK